MVLLSFDPLSPILTNLNIHRSGPSFDQDLATFRNELRPQSLELFETAECNENET